MSRELLGTISGLILLIVLIGGGLWYQGKTTSTGTATTTITIPWSSTSTPHAEISDQGIPDPNYSLSVGKFSDQSGVVQRYVNSAQTFSFGVPQGFTAEDYKTNDANTSAVLVFNQQTGEQLMLLITPTTETAIAENDITEPGVSGIAQTKLPDSTPALYFSSTNATWNGDAKELWFIYQDNEYQLSTNSTDADLIGYIVESWYWRQ